MYKLKSIAQRGMVLGAVIGLTAASLPPVQVLAYNELNPLTERSLLLSSSAPGFVDTDGSGNSTDSPNPTGNAYAPAGSGPNGKKTGQTFSFRVSTDSVADDRPIQAFTFQYCTHAAGICTAPGDANGDADEVAWADERSDLNVNHGNPEAGFVPFNIYMLDEDDVETDVTGDWELVTANREGVENGTGKNNFIALQSATGVSPEFNQKLKIVFNASEENYITNPGRGSFFVKMNTFDSVADDIATGYVPGSDSNIDGGVTVANMMTDSIHITTKVLETMQFSVGIELPEQSENPVDGSYGVCDAIPVINNNRIDLGNEDAENSLETDRAHEQNSFWRIQSNSSGGATVYYSGDTLRNTVGDYINPIDPEGSISIPGREQFGVALVSAQNDVHANFTQEMQEEDNSLQNPTLSPLTGVGVYETGDEDLGAYTSDGNGSARTERDGDGQWLKDDGTPVAGSPAESPNDYATFAFNVNSQTNPEPIAQGNQVLSCTTGKMRYIGNIGADTPAGVYTTKINYLAAPQY